jgi:hypothetical protein
MILSLRAEPESPEHSTRVAYSAHILCRATYIKVDGTAAHFLNNYGKNQTSNGQNPNLNRTKSGLKRKTSRTETKN